MKSDKDFDDKQNDFWLSEHETNTILHLQVFSQHLASMQLDQVGQFSVYDSELISDEFFKEEDITVLVNIIEAVNIWTESSTQLPSVSFTQTS